MEEITQGIYRHYKGDTYMVLGVAKHSETKEKLVLYSSSKGDLWVRPYDMFFEYVIHDGVQTQRFSLIDEHEVSIEIE